MSKKLKKALGLGLGVALASKFMGAKKDAAMKYMGGSKTGDANIAENISIFDKGMDKIARAGGVSKLKSGAYVMARGCKIGKKKPTKIV